MVDRLTERSPDDLAMEKAVGGAFARVGAVELPALERFGLDSVVIDVSCGSETLSHKRSAMPDIRYLGTDVVNTLLNYARRVCDRPDFLFSFNELGENGWKIFEGNIVSIEAHTPLPHDNIFMNYRDAGIWTETLGMDPVAIHKGEDSFLAEENARFQDTRALPRRQAFGQCLCVSQKRG